MATRSKSPTPELIDKERQVLELRRAGATFDDCARAVGYATPQGAYLAFHRALKRTLVAAGSEEMREQELDRLDRLQRSVWPNALQGDLSAVATVLRIMDRRAKYLGLDAAIKHDVTVENVDPTSIDAEVARLAAMLGDTSTTQDVTEHV
jgi:hypothetical protein